MVKKEKDMRNRRDNGREESVKWDAEQSRLKRTAVFYVCAELMRRGLNIYTQPWQNVQNVDDLLGYDIIASKSKTTQAIHVDVYGGYLDFIVPRKKMLAMNDAHEYSYFVIFVKLSKKHNVKPVYILLNPRLAVGLVNDESSANYECITHEQLIENEWYRENNWDELPVDFLP